MHVNFALLIFHTFWIFCLRIIEYARCQIRPVRLSPFTPSSGIPEINCIVSLLLFALRSFSFPPSSHRFRFVLRPSLHTCFNVLILFFSFNRWLLLIVYLGCSHSHDNLRLLISASRTLTVSPFPRLPSRQQALAPYILQMHSWIRMSIFTMDRRSALIFTLDLPQFLPLRNQQMQSKRAPIRLTHSERENLNTSTSTLNALVQRAARLSSMIPKAAH